MVSVHRAVNTAGMNLRDDVTIELADRLDAMDVLHRFAAGQDLRDEALFTTSFTADASLDFVQPARRLGVDLPVLHGRDMIVSTVMSSTAPLKTTHTVSNQRVSIEGDTARLTALVEAMHVLRADERRRLLLKNIYRCRLTRFPEGWRAREIAIDNVWIEGDPAVLFPS